MWAEIHTAGIPTSTPVLQSKRMAVDVGAKERSGAVESEPGSSGKARQLLMLPLQNLHLNVQHSGYSPGSYLSVLSRLTVSSIWAHLEGIRKKSRRWG